MTMRSIVTGCAVFAMSFAPATSLAEFWSIGTGTGLLSEGISNNGVVSGGANGYFVWTADSDVTMIGGTPPGNGIGGQGRISNDGTRISGTFLNPVSGFNEAAFYDVATGMWNPIGGIGGSSRMEISSGWGISGDGQHVVGLGWVSAGGAHAISGNLGGVTDLGSTMVGNSSRANGTDFDGNVVAGWQDGAGRQGAVWVDGVQELIFVNGSPALEAFGVSDDGTWVTGIGLNNFAPGQAYRYNTETNTSELLPNLTVGGQRSMAGTAITADGSTIVGGTWGFGPATLGQAIIWQEGVGTLRLDDYLDDINISYPDGYQFAFVTDISSDGQWLTGWGNGGSGIESWVVQIPEPASLSLLVVGLMIFPLRRR